MQFTDAISRRGPRRAASLAAAIALVPAMSSLALCQTAAAAAKPVTLTVWEGFAPSETTALNEMVAKYWTPSHPGIKINMVGSKTQQAMLIAMSGGESPDLVISGDSESPSLWYHEGAILNLTPLASQIQAQLRKEMVPASTEWGEEGNVTFALPFVDYNWGLFYNKALFKAAGLNPNEPPTTTQEVAVDAKKLTKYGSNGDIVQLGWMPVHDQWTALNLAMNFGAQFVGADGMPTLNSSGMNAALTWDSNLAKSFGLQKVENFISGFTNGDNPFALGKVGMYIDGCWQAAMLPAQAPKLDFGVGAIPASSPKYLGANDVGTNPIVVPKASSHVQQAEQFAVFLSLNQAIAANFSNDISNLPHIKSEVTSFTKDPRTLFFAKLSEDSLARAWAPVPYAEIYLTQLLNAVGQIYNNGANVSSTLAGAEQDLMGQAQQYK